MRVEVQAAQGDAALIRGIAETLRRDPERAEAIRTSVRGLLDGGQIGTVFDLFGSDLPDEAFDGVFATTRDRRWRQVDL